MVKNLVEMSLALVACCLLIGCQRGDSPEGNVLLTPTTSTAPTVDYQQVAADAQQKYGVQLRTNPKVVVSETEFEFGRMEPLTSGTHAFEIRNEGSAPLKLRVKDTSCKCTLGSLEDDEIPPGGKTQVMMEWNTGNKFAHYRQWAQIATNDPDNITLTFYISGTVRQEIRFEPEEIVFGEIYPGDTVQREVLVCSDQLNEFELENVVTTHPGFVAAVQPATAEQLAAAKAIRGFVVKLTSNEEVPHGSFLESLRLNIKRQPTDDDPQPHELSIVGSVKGRLSITGTAINAVGQVEFGTLGYGQGAIAKMKLKVRDSEHELKLRELKVSPEFVKVTLKPTASVLTSGLYDLIVEIPRDTEPCGFRGDNMGKIHFAFDHPRIPKLDLLVDFSVRPPEELR